MVLLRKQVSAELKNVTPLASRSKHLHSTTLEYPQYERAATGIHVPAPHEFPMAVINLHSSQRKDCAPAHLPRAAEKLARPADEADREIGDRTLSP